MPDENETKRIEALYGPFAGGMIDVPTADAEQAISDGWARDPFATPDPDAKQPEWTQESHEKVLAAADAAARKIRGEDEDVKKKTDKKSAAGKDKNADTQAAVAETRTAQSEAGKEPLKGSDYRTRTSSKKE